MVRKKEIVARLGQLDLLRQAVCSMEQELALKGQKDKPLCQRLKSTRQQVALLEGALQVLNPEERIVAEMLLICPQRGNVQRLCEILHVEQSSVYRRRDRAIQKVGTALCGEVFLRR